MRGILEPEHLLLILLTVLVMFGGKKIPELAAGLGKGVREFKRGLGDDGPRDPAPPLTVAAAQVALPAAATTAPVVAERDAAPGPKRLL